MTETSDLLVRFLLPEAGVRGAHVQLDAAWREIIARNEDPDAVRDLLGQAVAAAALLRWALGLDPLTTVLSGGLLFGAVYMATDYVTSPLNRWAQIVYAIGIGVIVVIIRKFGAYPEGVTYAILLMNIAAPLLDRVMPQKIYGCRKTRKEAK